MLPRLTQLAVGESIESGAGNIKNASDMRADRRGCQDTFLSTRSLLLGCHFLGERSGQHELGFEHIGVVDEAVQGRRREAGGPDAGTNARRRKWRPVLRSYPRLVQRFGGDAQLDNETARRFSGSASPRFSFQSRSAPASSGLVRMGPVDLSTRAVLIRASGKIAQ